MIDPLVDVIGIESDEVAHLDERDATLGDQPPDVPRRHIEAGRQLADVEESTLTAGIASPG